MVAMSPYGVSVTAPSTVIRKRPRISPVIIAKWSILYAGLKFSDNVPMSYSVPDIIFAFGYALHRINLTPDTSTTFMLSQLLFKVTDSLDILLFSIPVAGGTGGGKITAAGYKMAWKISPTWPDF